MKKAIIISALIIIAAGGIYYYWDKAQVVEEVAPAPGETSFSTLPTDEETDTANWQTYRNEEYGFEFRHPFQWKIEETFESDRITVRAKDPTAIEGNSVTFSYGPNPDRLTGRQWFDKNVFKTEAEIVGEITIDGIPALETQSSGKYTINSVLVGKNDYLVSISYFVGLTNKETFNQILSTFKFTK